MPKIDLGTAPTASGSRYPAPFDIPCQARRMLKLGDAAGLTQFGVNLLTLEPGVWSAQRHWHVAEDEFVWVLEGEVTLVDDAGDTALRPGDCAGFPANDPNGHCLQNRSDQDAVMLVVGTRNPLDHGDYTDIDMTFEREGNPSGGGYFHKDGTPY